jgi:phosphatidylserine/phosphatidylglycerophosphate/cardiolipin synthase-like enzyme
MGNVGTVGLDDWFLEARERGNPATRIDERADPGAAWTDGNHVTVHVDGAAYFACLLEELRGLRRGDWLHFTDWEGDPDERLAGEGTELASVLCELARDGVHVRGLLWRSHPRQAHFAEQENLGLTKDVNEAGGEILLDERVRRGGSHHQKLFVIRHSDDADHDVAFVGGIDLCHGRHDTPQHEGDRQAVDIDDKYGLHPPWHDVQAAVHGPAVGAIADTFRERWEDDTPLDHRNPIRTMLRRTTRQPRRPDPLPAPRRDPAPCGSHSVQVLRTYPAKRPPYPFAPNGERSIARAYLKAFKRARALVYFEDQYFWSETAAWALADALRANPALRVITVVPRYPDEDGAASGRAANIGRERAMDIVRDAGGERVLVCDLENRHGTPIYVHAKVCVIDDVWMVVGSDNVNRRSWTHDSELSCAIVDATRDAREPTDPAGLGDGARVLARDTRLRLWREHLGRDDGDDADLVDPVRGFEAFRDAARALDQWADGGRNGARPPGHARIHDPERVEAHHKWWAQRVHRAFLDPDGRPRDLRRRDAY